MKHLIVFLCLLTLGLTFQTACKKESSQTIKYSFIYDNKEYELMRGMMIHYKTDSNKYYYIITVGNDTCVYYDYPTMDHCIGDFIKLNLVADSIGIMPNKCEIIFDYYSYVKLGNENTYGPYETFDYIISGSMFFDSYSAGAPRSFRMNGETKSGKKISIHARILDN